MYFLRAYVSVGDRIYLVYKDPNTKCVFCITTFLKLLTKKSSESMSALAPRSVSMSLLSQSNSTALLVSQVSQLKRASKELQRESRRCEVREKNYKSSAVQSIQSGKEALTRIASENAIREKRQAEQFARLAARLEALASRVETAVRTQKLTVMMARIVHGMTQAHASCKYDQLDTLMQELDAAFQEAEKRADSMMKALDNSTSTSMPTEEVDAFIRLLADEHNLDVAERIGLARTPPPVTTEDVSTLSTSKTPIMLAAAPLRVSVQDLSNGIGGGTMAATAAADAATPSNSPSLTSVAPPLSITSHEPTRLAVHTNTCNSDTGGGSGGGGCGGGRDDAAEWEAIERRLTGTHPCA